MATYTDVIKKIQPAKIGIAELVHDTPDPLTRLRARMHGQPLERDKYARLLVRGYPVMTDAEFERWTNADLLDHAKGDVLLAGLGIGLVLEPLLRTCKSITVVEKEADVIALIGVHFPAVKIIHSDIFKFKPAKGEKWDTIYFDIWADICADDEDEADKLHAKFKPYLRRGGWMRSWCKIALRFRR